MAGTAMEPMAEKPVKNLPASIHLRHHKIGDEMAVHMIRDNVCTALNLHYATLPAGHATASID